MLAKRVRVCLVDDQPLVREWLGGLLQAQPELALGGEAGDAPMALATMLAHPPDIALIALSLPGGAALALIRNLQARIPGTATIGLAMPDEVVLVKRALQAGARGCVLKCEAADRMVEAIRHVLRGHVYTSPELRARLLERQPARRPAAPAVPLARLSRREREVFRRLGTGQTTRAIATALGVNIKTVQAYCARINERLHLAGRANLVRQAARWMEAKRTG